MLSSLCSPSLIQIGVVQLWVVVLPSQVLAELVPGLPCVASS